jgi:hypothetical protein
MTTETPVNIHMYTSHEYTTHIHRHRGLTIYTKHAAPRRSTHWRRRYRAHVHVHAPYDTIATETEKPRTELADIKKTELEKMESRLIDIKDISVFIRSRQRCVRKTSNSRKTSNRT